MPYLTDLDKALNHLDKTLPAYLIISPDRVRLEHIERRFLESRGLGDSPALLFFGDTLHPRDITSIRDELSSSNLFTSTQIVRMVRADEMKAPVLDAFLKKPPEGESSNILMLIASKLNAQSRLRKYFQKRSGLLELKPIAPKEINAWTMSHGTALGLELTGRVADLIAEIGEQKPDRIDQLLQHLAMYCETDKKPKSEDVLALFHHHPDPNEFQLLEQILLQPPHQAERSVHELLENGKNAFLLLNLLGKSASRLLQISFLFEQGLSRGEITEQLGLSPWLFDKQLKLLKQTKKRKLFLLHQAIISADAKLKGKSLGPETIFGSVIHSV